MLFTGWVSFLLAWVFTALFYKTHPSSVDSGWRGKLFIYVFGRKRYVCVYEGKTIHSILHAIVRPQSQVQSP